MPKGDREIFKADIEDGYTRIANLLLETFAMASLNGIQKGICLFIIRRTYSWNKKEDEINLKDFAKACNTDESYVSRQIKKLIEWQIIIRTNYQPGKTPSYSINTRVEQWCKGCIDVQGLNEYTIQGLYKCARVGLYEYTRVDKDQTLEPVVKEDSLKKEVKENIKKLFKDINKECPNSKSEKIFDEDSWEYKFANALRNWIKKNNPKAKVPDDKELQKWAKVFDLILRIDDRSVDDVTNLITFSQNHKFWKINILSPESFRKHFDRLMLEYKKAEDTG